MNLRTLDNAISAVLLLGGFWIVLTSIGYDYMLDSVPGAGFFPFWVGALLVGCVLCDVVGRFRKRAVTEDVISGREIGQVAAVVTTFGFMCLAADFVGLVIPTAIMMVFTGLLMADRPITRRFIGKLVAVTAATIALGYYVFAHLLSVPLT